MGIKRIEFKSSDPRGDIIYAVGNHCDEIKINFRNGEMAPIPYYDIFRNGKLIAELHNFSHIEYFEEEV